MANFSSRTVTWLNHYTVQMVMASKIDMSVFSDIGIDGQLLRRLMKVKSVHTSADEDLPRILSSSKNLRVGLVGGDSKNAKLHIQSTQRAFPDVEVCWSLSGYDSEILYQILEAIELKQPDLILLGLGAPRQDILASALRQQLDGKNVNLDIYTCGGWLDQLGINSYYPKWATAMNLRWLVRLSREPLRLVNRYTYWAALAVIRRRQILRFTEPLRSRIILSHHDLS